MVEVVGVSLGAVSLFFQAYDNCRRLYGGYENLRHFGKDMQILLARLQVIEWDLDMLMETRTSELLKPPGLENSGHPVTKQILVHLGIILTYFKNCNKVIAATFKDSGWTFSENDGTVAPSTATSQAPSLISRHNSQEFGDSLTTPADSLASDQHKHLGVRNLFRGLSLSKSSRKHRDTTQPREQSSASQADSGISTVTNVQSNDAPVSALAIPYITVGGVAATALSMQDESIRRLRADASWWTLIKWSDHNKDALEAEINKLSRSVTAFRRYLELREPRRPGRVLAVDSSAALNHYHPRMPPAAVRELHDALKSINPGPIKTAVFSLSIAESCDSNRRAIEDIPDVQGSLRLESKMFFLQKEEKDGQSTFMAVEQGDGPLTDSHKLHFMSATDSIFPPEQSDSDSLYVSCGVIGPVGVSSVFHNVFVDVKAWQASNSFSEYLVREDLRCLLTPRALVDVFRTILMAYLDLEKVRHLCRYPRLEDYKTYAHPQYDDDRNNSASPVSANWRMPYWSCRFGTPLPHRIPGASIEEHEADQAVVQLGLVLHQLGSGSRSIMAPGPTGSIKPWRNLKLEALNNFEEVSRTCGLVFANVVQACLLANARTEKEVVCSCLMSLENLQIDLDS